MWPIHVSLRRRNEDALDDANDFREAFSGRRRALVCDGRERDQCESENGDESLHGCGQFMSPCGAGTKMRLMMRMIFAKRSPVDGVRSSATAENAISVKAKTAMSLFMDVANSC